MKIRTLIQAAAVAAVAIAPALASAQQVDPQQTPKTRAEVRQELIQLERAGYDPAAANDATYPSDIQAAEARVHQQDSLARGQGAPDTTGYGPSTAGTTQSGSGPTMAPRNPNYVGH